METQTGISGLDSFFKMFEKKPSHKLPHAELKCKCRKGEGEQNGCTERLVLIFYYSCTKSIQSDKGQGL